MNLDQWRRGAGTALSFAIFGVGGLLIGVLISPLLRLAIHDRDRRQRLARQLIRRLFRAFIAIMKVQGVLDYRLTNIERLQCPGQLILANHPSLIDVIFLIAHTPNATCIVKGRLASNPFTRGPIRVAGYITNRDPEAVLDAARASLARGESLVLFPEGTRTTPGRPIRFRRGAANIALCTDAPIIPVLIDCTPTTLTKGDPWYHIPKGRVMMSLYVLGPLAATTSSLQRAQQARQLTRELSDHFNEAMERLYNEQNAAAVS